MDDLKKESRQLEKISFFFPLLIVWDIVKKLQDLELEITLEQLK
jgi:hypothetical protein